MNQRLRARRETRANNPGRMELLAVITVMVMAWSLMPGQASSHREAPLTATDPMADNTDVYAFRSPDEPDKAR